MERINLNLELFAETVMARAATLESARQRRMLEVYVEHTRAEIAGDIDRTMATMCAEPRFHVWTEGQEIGPKGREEVRNRYLEMFALNANYLQIDIKRLVIDDHCMVKEYIQTNLLPGINFIEGPRADNLRSIGETPDRDAHYMSQGRVLVLIPFDADCKMMGEDAYTAGRSTVRKVALEELPESYLARVMA